MPQVEFRNGGGWISTDPSALGLDQIPNNNRIHQNQSYAIVGNGNSVVEMGGPRGQEVTAFQPFEIEEPLPPMRPVPFDKSQIRKKFPVFIVAVSFFQTLLFHYGGETAWLLFCIDPFRRHELWRYFTTMLVHASIVHLWSNLLFSLLLGSLLEIVHHWKRIGVIYMSGVVGGSMAITVFDPKRYGLGASAGVYALLTAHLATIIINWSQMNRKCCRVFWLLAYITFDIGINAYVELSQQVTTEVSHAGHFGGALTGFLVAIFVLKNFEKHPWEKKVQKICAFIISVLVAAVIIINISFPTYYLKTEWNFHYNRTLVMYTVELVDESPPDSEIRKACDIEPDCKLLFQQFKDGTLKFQD